MFYLLFGFCPPSAKMGGYWDWTTLALRTMLRKTLRPGMRFLDVGTGPYAVLARYAYCATGCADIVASDVRREAVDYAKIVHGNSPISFVTSDLFENTPGVFDVIAFNAPYVDAEEGMRKGIFADPQSGWRSCGGRQGVETIGRFLRALPEHLKADGAALLGVNLFHISHATVQTAIQDAGLRVAGTRRNSVTRACVYVLKAR